MKLALVGDLAKAIGFDQGVATDKLETAVETATQTLIGLLRTEFDLAAVVDDFYVLSTGSIPIGSTYRTRLALSRGFISGPVTITFGRSLDALASSPGMVEAGRISVDRDKGGIVITGPDMRDTFIRVSYVAGFGAEEDDPTTYEQTELPDWLKEVAVMASLASLDSTHPDLRFENGNGAKESAASMTNSVVGRLGSKIRYFPSATHPIG